MYSYGPANRRAFPSITHNPRIRLKSGVGIMDQTMPGPPQQTALDRLEANGDADATLVVLHQDIMQARKPRLKRRAVIDRLQERITLLL